MNNYVEQSRSREPRLHLNIQLALYLAFLALLLNSCTPAQATETSLSPTSPPPIDPAPALVYTPEAELEPLPTLQIPEPTPESPEPPEEIESIDQIIESFKVGGVDLTEPTVAFIPSAVWELLAQNKSGINKTGDHELLFTEPHFLSGANWTSPENATAIKNFDTNSFTAWLPSNPLEQWHVGLLLDTNVPGHNATINHSYWKQSLGEIGYYAGSADPDTQAKLIGQTFQLYNKGNPDVMINAKFLAITMIPVEEYQNWTTGPAGNLQADLAKMGIPQDVLDIQDSNIIHLMSCMPSPGTSYNPLDTESNNAWRAIISLELTPQETP